MDAFDNTSASKDYGSAASSFASFTSQKKALADSNEAAAAIAAPATEER